MDASEPRLPARALPARALATLTLSSSIGALIGLGRGWGEIAANGYSSLGFRRSMFLALRDSTVDLTWKAASIGLALFALAEVGALFAPDRTGLSRSLARRIASSALARSRIMTVSISALGVLVFVLDLRDSRGLGLAALTLACVASFAVLHRFAARYIEDAALVAAIYCAFGLAVGGAWFQNVDFLNDPFHPRNIYGNAGLAVAVAFCFVQLRATGGRGALRTLVPVLLAMLLWGSAPILGSPTIELENPKNVLLIGIDTLRFDRTSLEGAEGGDRDLTPHMRRLADEGLSFRSAVAPAPWTLPSFASFVTGKYPQEHGAVSLSGRLSERQLTFSEILREAGYRTAGVSSSWYVDELRGFSQGFESFDERNIVGGLGFTSAGVTDQAIELLNGVGDEPWFLFLVYFDPHYEFENHADHVFSDDYDGWLRSGQRQIVNLRLKRQLLEPDDIRFLRDLYDEEVAATDREIGRLIEHLESTGMKDDVAIVVVADHGEELMEHGWLGHTISMYQEVLNVPLILKLPGVERSGMTHLPVEARRIFPTLIDYLGVRGADHLKEESILPCLAGESSWAPAFASSMLRGAPMFSGKRVDLYSAQLGSWKLIRDEILGKDLLFDLQEDPGELRNMASVEKDMLRALSGQLMQWRAEMASSRRNDQLELTAEEAQRLRDLGYL